MMVVSRVSTSELVNTLFDDEFCLSEDDNNDGTDEDCIYGYLGAAVLNQPESRVDLPSKDEADMQSFLEGTNDSYNSPEPSSTSDSNFLAASSSGEDVGNVDLPATLSKPSSEVTIDHMVS